MDSSGRFTFVKEIDAPTNNDALGAARALTMTSARELCC
jgi:hypothetical protein